jgi:uncharacterized membrane protein YhaH (DUF805 family)
MDMVNSYITNYVSVLKKYAVFSGRASRSEYWQFVLVSIIISIILGIVDDTLGLSRPDGGGVLSDIYVLVVLIPSIAVGVRRIHDGDRSGWWILLPLYNLYLLIIKGTAGPNRFGPDSVNPDAVSPMPVAASAASVASETPMSSGSTTPIDQSAATENNNQM